MHVEEIAMGQRCSLHYQFTPLADIGNLPLQHGPEHPATVLLPGVVGITAALQIAPKLPGFTRRGVCVQNMAPRRRHPRIQHRRNGEHNSIAIGCDAALPVVHPDGVDRQIIEATGVKAQVQMQKSPAGRRGCTVAAPAGGHPVRQQRQRAPDIGIAHHLIGTDAIAIGESHPAGAAVLHEDLLHPGLGAQGAAMALETLHQGIHHSRTAPHGVIQAGLGIEPIAEQRGHGRSIRVAHRHAADQETQQVHPVAQEGILQVPIHQWPEGTGEMAHRREMTQQLRTALQQLGHGIQPRPQSQKR